MSLEEIKKALKSKEREIEILKLDAEEEIYRILQELADKFQTTITIYSTGVNLDYDGRYDEELQNSLYKIEEEVDEMRLYLIHEKVFQPIK